MSDEADRESLRSKVSELTPQQVVVVNQYVDALLTPVAADINTSSWFATSVWADAFLTRLRAHHALSAQPLSREQFETAFEASCEAAAWTVTSATSTVQRFYDTIIDRPGGPRKRISLKATAAKDIKPEWIHISKLTEGAWIQDSRTRAVRRDAIVALFKEFREACDCIVILRCFRDDGDMLYELVEVPSDLFKAVDNLSANEAWEGTIGIPHGSTEPYLKIRIDRSDAKVTLTGIQLGVCIVHGRWRMTPTVE